MRKVANLRSGNIGFAFVIFIVLAIVGGGRQAWAEGCPPSPAYTPDFSSNKPCLALNDNAVIPLEGPAVLQLTANSTNQVGSAWYTTPQVVQNGFTTNFQFQLTPAGGADGIAFVIQNAGTSAIGFTGGNGGALGYGDDDANEFPNTGIQNSLAIEFDVFQNSWDLAGSHVAVQSCGTGPNTSHHGQFCNGGDGPSSTLGAPVLTSATLADGNVHTVTIKYSAAPTPNIHVILDGTDMYPEGVNVNLASLLTLGTGGTAFVGFTGATGALTETQNILSWTFSSISSAPDTTFTTPSQTTTQGGSNQFTDPGGSGTTQTYQFATNTSFNDDNGGSCSSPTMAIQFQYWDPTVFNSSRLPGIPQNPNWCSVPGNPGLTCTTPVPAQTTCVPVVTANGSKCIVEEAQCSCGGNQLAHCNVTGTSGPILVTNANNNYVSPPTNPGLVIGDDGQNNWAVMPQAPDGSTCTTNCSTQKLNTDMTILDVLQPDFSLAANPTTLNLGVGGSGTSTLSLSALNGFNGAVTLTVPSPPAGITTTLSSASVTPPSSPSSATSTLTVSLGPSVVPTSFTLNVSGNNGTPPTNLTHFAFVTVNVTANTSGITSVIGSLSNLCIDNSGIVNALTSKLSAAQGFISAGKTQDAINTLTAFNNQVKAQTGKHIYSSCVIGGVTIYPGTVLTTDAQSLINSLRTGTIADPITGYALNSSGAGLQGATVAIYAGTSASGTPIATATTDVTGFYYFATTNLLTSGQAYTIAVTGFPAGYTTATPTYSTFTWTGVGFGSNFTLNP